MVNLPCLMVSCTNFLRPTCPYTECRLSLHTGSCPREWTTASYSSCLYLILTDLVCLQKTDRSVDAFLLLPSVGLVAFGTLFPCPSCLQVPLPEPCQSPEPSEYWQDPGTISMSGVCSLCCLCVFLYRMFYIRQHLSRVISFPAF